MRYSQNSKNYGKSKRDQCVDGTNDKPIEYLLQKFIHRISPFGYARCERQKPLRLSE